MKGILGDMFCRFVVLYLQYPVT